jgi:L-arabinokinase
VEDPNWNGYLANVLPGEWAAFRERVPLQMTGADFLSKYRGFTDAVTKIEPERQYAVRQPTAHPILEHDRVQRFRDLLAEGEVSDALLAELGELMYQSHASYSACGLGSSGTDRLVELARAAGPREGIFGAKITGGGSGGTVAVLARTGSRQAVDAIAAKYERETRRRTLIQTGSSDGAIRSGTWKGRRSVGH